VTPFPASPFIATLREGNMIRNLFTAVALVTAGFLAATAAQTVQPKIPVPTVPLPGELDPQMPYFRVCAKACDDCARACDISSAHGEKLLADGKKEHLDPLKLCEDCAAICSAAGGVVAKDGPLSDAICTACAEACKRCGDACEKQGD